MYAIIKYLIVVLSIGYMNGILCSESELENRYQKPFTKKRKQNTFAQDREVLHLLESKHEIMKRIIVLQENLIARLRSRMHVMLIQEGQSRLKEAQLDQAIHEALLEVDKKQAVMESQLVRLMKKSMARYMAEE